MFSCHAVCVVTAHAGRIHAPRRTTVPTLTSRVAYYTYYMLLTIFTILAMAMQVMLYGYTLSFLWIGDEAEQPWTRQPHVEMVVCSLDTWC